MAHKVLLITDNSAYFYGLPRYIGPYRIAHALEEKGISTMVLDHFYQFENFFSVLEATLTDEFIAIGISSTFMTHPKILEGASRFDSREKREKAYSSLHMVGTNEEQLKSWHSQFNEVIRRKSPKAKTIIGGTKASLYLNANLPDIVAFDYVALGPMDQVFPDVVRDLIERGECYHVIMSGKKVIDVFDHYRQPKTCPKHQWKKHWHIQSGEALPIEMARGCAFNCKFCNFEKNANSRKSLEDLRYELISNYEHFGTTFYLFTDDCFNDHRTKVESICNLILQLPFKIEWVSYARFDVAVRFPETAYLMVESGARGLHWGIESLTYEVARRAGKGTHPDKIKDFICDFSQKTRNVCYNEGSLIVGLPGETTESFMAQADWLCSSQTFDFLYSGPLSLGEYNAQLDQRVVDYADYVRNPRKYGFEEIRFNPQYWRHTTMDSLQADRVNDAFSDMWKSSSWRPHGLGTSIWCYPHLRSLGFSPEEINSFYFSTNDDVKRFLYSKWQNLSSERLKNYKKAIETLAKTQSKKIISL